MAVQDPQKPEMGAPTSPQCLMQMIAGAWPAQCIYVLSKLGIPDLLENGPMTAEALAQELSVHPRGLYRVLRTLGKLDILVEGEGHRFSLAPLGAYLQSNHPASMRALAIMMGEEHYQAWGSLLHSVQTNESAFEQVYQTQTFEYFKHHPEASEIFNQAMTMFCKQSTPVAEGYDFSQFKTLVDVAGGHGYLLAAILKAHPALQGILYDLPHVIAGAQPVLTEAEVTNRCEVVAGDFFQAVPAGADGYFLSHIIHDWDDEHALKILENIHQAMAPGGKVLLFEHVVDSPNASPFTNLMDLNMMVMTHGGGERTEEEFRALLEKAGFQLTRLVPVPSIARYVIEGIRK